MSAKPGTVHELIICSRQNVERIEHTAVQPIHGTMKLHVVVGWKDPRIFYNADESC